jgi:hypothetical protein
MSSDVGLFSRGQELRDRQHAVGDLTSTQPLWLPPGSLASLPGAPASVRTVREVWALGLSPLQERCTADELQVRRAPPVRM